MTGKAWSRCHALCLTSPRCQVEAAPPPSGMSCGCVKTVQVRQLLSHALCEDRDTGGRGTEHPEGRVVLPRGISEGCM